MKNYLSISLGLLFTVFALNGCQMTRLLRENHSEMKRLAYEDLPKEEKFDGLAEELVEVLETSLTYSSPLKSYKYLNKFTQQNEAELNALSKELGPWIKQMKLIEKIKFTKSVMKSPYSKRMTQVVPKVQKMARENGYKLGTLEKILLIYKVKGLLK